MSEKLHETADTASNNINTKGVIGVLCLIVSGVLVIYVSKFHYPLSKTHADWGTFGDYFGGILNPIIAAFAFYLIAKTYELQKRELEETRKLLKVSTDAQNQQIKLAALTASLNSNLTNISILQSEKSSLFSQFVIESSDKELALRVKFLGNLPFGCPPDPDDEHYEKYLAEYESLHDEYESLIDDIKIDKGDDFFWIIKRIIDAEREINDLINENNKLKAKIEAFSK
jgi:large-conductance mechanosensitive channel